MGKYTDLPATCHSLFHEPTGVEVYLVSTVHYSLKSKEDVEKVIRTVRPNAVVLELCPSRAHILVLDEDEIKRQMTDLSLRKIVRILRRQGVVKGILDLMLLNATIKTMKQLGVVPGIDFRTAYREAQKISNCEVVLGDRPIEITLHRAWNSLPWAERAKMAKDALSGNPAMDLSGSDLETLKDPVVLEKMMATLEEQYPGFYKILLTERNIYLTHSLHSTSYFVKNRLAPEGGKVVGVVGIGHAKGIIELFPHDQRKQIPALLQMNYSKPAYFDIIEPKMFSLHDLCKPLSPILSPMRGRFPINLLCLQDGIKKAHATKILRIGLQFSKWALAGLFAFDFLSKPVLFKKPFNKEMINIYCILFH